MGAGHSSRASIHDFDVRSMSQHHLITAALSNSLHPLIKRVDVLFEFIWFGKWCVLCGGLIVTQKPLRAFFHPDIECFAVSIADVSELPCALCLNAVPVPYNDLSQEHFFDPSLPSFAKETIYVGCLLFVLLLVSRSDKSLSAAW